MPLDAPVTIATLLDSLLICTIVLDPPPNVHRCELRLERHRSRLDEILSRAATFARMIASCPEVGIDPATVETNIVRLRLRGVAAGQFAVEARCLGVHMLPSGPSAVRAVFCLDIRDSDMDPGW
jgi:hypothetical protein